MSEQAALFAHPEVIAQPANPDALSPGRRRTLRQKRLLAAGRHPATLVALAADRGTCGECVHSHRHDHGNRAYWKCELHRLGESASEASDIRVSWPACIRFEVG